MKDILRENATYPVLCAWCDRKGKRTLIKWSSVEGSFGICGPCADRVRKRIKPMKTGKVFEAKGGSYVPGHV